MEKIRACDVFVCDITTINSEAPAEFRRVPNPNVAFELGFAVATVGWSRILMLVNGAFASLADAPFDIDRHRILPYKIEGADGNYKGNLAQLATLLNTNIASIVEHEPSKPGVGEQQSPEQVRRARDIVNLTWLLSNVHFPTLDQMIEDLPQRIHSRALHFWEGFNGVVKNSLFHLYDADLLAIVKEMHRLWEVCVSHGEQYQSTTHPDIYLFKNPNSTPFTPRQTEAWEAINVARSSLVQAQATLLSAIRDRYLEIDIDNTNAAAWREYMDMEKDVEQQFKRSEA